MANYLKIQLDDRGLFDLRQAVNYVTNLRDTMLPTAIRQSFKSLAKALNEPREATYEEVKSAYEVNDLKQFLANERAAANEMSKIESLIKTYLKHKQVATMHLSDFVERYELRHLKEQQ